MSIPNSDPDDVLDARFLWAIETWCAAKGMSVGAFGVAVYRDRGLGRWTGRSLLGRNTTGNPSFVAQLLGGVSPKLATEEAVRATMKSHAIPAEWREIRVRASAMPAIMTGARLPFPELPARPVNHEPEPERPGRRRHGPVL